MFSYGGGLKPSLGQLKIKGFVSVEELGVSERSWKKGNNQNVFSLKHNLQ